MKLLKFIICLRSFNILSPNACQLPQLPILTLALQARVNPYLQILDVQPSEKKGLVRLFYQLRDCDLQGSSRGPCPHPRALGGDRDGLALRLARPPGTHLTAVVRRRGLTPGVAKRRVFM